MVFSPKGSSLLDFPFPCRKTSILKVSPQPLVSLGTNRYSVPLGYQGKEVICHLFHDRVELVDKDQILASHSRLEGKYGLGVDIHHHLPLLAIKLRAVTGIASFRTLPAVFVRVRDDLVSSRGREGWKEMVAILLLLQDYPMEEVENALVKAEEARAVRADTVRQFLILKSTPNHFDVLLSVGGAA